MKLLFVSNLFPNAAEPVRGVFNAQQVAAFSKLCEVTVVAPTGQTMSDENRAGVRVIHPRFFHVPVLSRPLNGWLFAKAVGPVIRRERFDMVLASWAYPDAYGVMLVAETLKFPFATATLGSDVNVLFENPTRKQQILRALHASRVVFAKSKALQSRLAAEGIESVIDYNGIDHEKFRPIDRAGTCRQLGLDPERPRVLYVGNLLPVKGPTVLAEAYKFLISPPEPSEGSGSHSGKILRSAQNGNFDDVELIFVGSGPEKITAGRCVGARPHEEIPLWMNACDILCLPSLNEGLPNVALEAMACGLPVVASCVGGVPEIVCEGVNGFLVPPSDPPALAEALQRALTTKWDREAIRASVSQFDWDVNARALVGALQRVITP